MPKGPSSNSIPLEQEVSANANVMDVSSATVTTSRYGRTCKPKVSNDYCSIDAALSSNSDVQIPLSVRAYSPKKTANNLHKSPTLMVDDIDVNDVLKIVAKTPEVNFVPLENGKSVKNQIKTYCNKKKSFYYKNEIVESFGLPDSPIVEKKFEFAIELLPKSEIDVNCIIKPDDVRIDNKILTCEPWNTDVIFIDDDQDFVKFTESMQCPKDKVKEEPLISNNLSGNNGEEIIELLDVDDVQIANVSGESVGENEVQISSLSAKLQQAIRANKVELNVSGCRNANAGGRTGWKNQSVICSKVNRINSANCSMSKSMEILHSTPTKKSSSVSPLKEVYVIAEDKTCLTVKKINEEILHRHTLNDNRDPVKKIDNLLENNDDDDKPKITLLNPTIETFHNFMPEAIHLKTEENNSSSEEVKTPIKSVEKNCVVESPDTPRVRSRKAKHEIRQISDDLDFNDVIICNTNELLDKIDGFLAGNDNKISPKKKKSTHLLKENKKTKNGKRKLKRTVKEVEAPEKHSTDAIIPSFENESNDEKVAETVEKKMEKSSRVASNAVKTRPSDGLRKSQRIPMESEKDTISFSKRLTRKRAENVTVPVDDGNKSLHEKAPPLSIKVENFEVESGFACSKRRIGRPRKYPLSDNDTVDLTQSDENYENDTAEDFSRLSDVKIKEEIDDTNLSSHDDNKSMDFAKIELQFQAGDLTWARIGSHPYWPCLVITDPDSNTFVKHRIIKRLTSLYHVRFFADNGRRSWTSSHNIIPFLNGDDLKKMYKDISSKQFKAKINKDILAACMVNKNKLPKWVDAVAEAESLMKKSREDRIDFFNVYLKPKRNTVDGFSNILDRKRKKSYMDTTLPNLHLEKSRVKSRVFTRASSLPPRNLKVATATDKTLRTTENKLESSMKDVDEAKLCKNSRKSSDEMRKKMKKLDADPSFQAYVKSNIKLMRREHPDLKDSTLEVMLHKLWDVLEPSLKKFYKSNETCNSEYAPSDVADTKVDSKVSPSPLIFESYSAKQRKKYLFKGVSKEKVCQICEKGVNVLKCKGTCGGLFHIKCMEDEAKSEFVTSDCSFVSNDSESETMDSSSPIQSQDESTDITAQQENSALQDPQVASSSSLGEKIDAKLQELMQDVKDITKYCDSTTDDNSTKGESPIKMPQKNKCLKIKHVTADGVFTESDDEQPLNESKITTCDEFICKRCTDGIIPLCFICGKATSKNGNSIREKCSLHQCGKYYHHDCLKLWPQTQWSHSKKNDNEEDTFTCPSHYCHTCMCDDPRGATARCANDKLAKCLYCPVTYHISTYCIPAGTEILSSHQIVCARHYLSGSKKKMIKSMKNVNASWCFICSEGGSLICCETCPTSFHAECLKISPPDDSFICEDCESGRFPLYNEIAWVKLGSYRWWPAIILYPSEIPENVKNIKHNRGEFAVRFFGTHDHYWVNRGRVFIFQEGDTGNTSAKRTSVDGLFLRAIEEAAVGSKSLKEEKERRTEEFRNSLKPPTYIKIRCNKPVGNVKLFDGNTSNTTPCECDPDSKNPCGPDSDCLNRILLTECDPLVCPAGTICENQRFEKRKYPSLVPYKTQGRGWGLKVLTPLQKGDFIIEYVGEMIDESEYQRRLQKMHEKKDENYYFLTIDKDRMLDAGPKGNVARFMNHSCQPNCETQKWTVNGSTRVGLFASIDIPGNTELTFNYNLECVGEERKICKCGAPNCSGYIGVKAKQQVEQSKKTKKQKLKSKKKKISLVVPNLGPCFKCGKPDNVGACHNKLCNKFYHSQCVGLDIWPEGKWFCPCHSCNICSKRTIRSCAYCTNSYCPPHSVSNIRYDKSTSGFICSVHDTSTNASPEDVAAEENVDQQPAHKSNDQTVEPCKSKCDSIITSVSNISIPESPPKFDVGIETSKKADLSPKSDVNNETFKKPLVFNNQFKRRSTRLALDANVTPTDGNHNKTENCTSLLSEKFIITSDKQKEITAGCAEEEIIKSETSKVVEIVDDVKMHTAASINSDTSSEDESNKISYMKSLNIVAKQSAVLSREGKRRSIRLKNCPFLNPFSIWVEKPNTTNSLPPMPSPIIEPDLLIDDIKVVDINEKNKSEIIENFIKEKRRRNNINFDLSVVLIKTPGLDKVVNKRSKCVKKAETHKSTITLRKRDAFGQTNSLEKSSLVINESNTEQRLVEGNCSSSTENKPQVSTVISRSPNGKFIRQKESKLANAIVKTVLSKNRKKLRVSSNRKNMNEKVMKSVATKKVRHHTDSKLVVISGDLSERRDETLKIHNKNVLRGNKNIKIKLKAATASTKRKWIPLTVEDNRPRKKIRLERNTSNK